MCLYVKTVGYWNGLCELVKKHELEFSGLESA